MDNAFWNDMWLKSDQPPFHEHSYHSLLEKYIYALSKPTANYCFVPLCGKSHDLFLLANHCKHVYGYELSQIAVEQFFNFYKLKYKQKRISASCTLFTSDKISIFCGDIFELDSHYLPSCDMVYDRAALVALPYSSRQRYVDLVMSVIPKNGRILLLTMDFKDKLDQLPPLATSPHEILNLYKKAQSIKLIHHKQHTLNTSDSLYQRGVTKLTHNAHLITI